MPALQEQHEKWAAAHMRLFPRQPEPRIRPSLIRVARVAPVPALPSEWPFQPAPAPYDHCERDVTLKPRRLTWREIAREVAWAHRLTFTDLISARRDRAVCAARYEAFWRCHRETLMSKSQIGLRFGGRDHTTVIAGIRRHLENMEAALAAA